MFYWVNNFDDIKGWRIIGRGEICGELDTHYGFDPDVARNEGVEVYSAFTVAELGEMLPEMYIHTDKKDNGYWNIRYQNPNGGMSDYIIGGATEADARAKMLIYLLENKLIKL